MDEHYQSENEKKFFDFIEGLRIGDFKFEEPLIQESHRQEYLLDVEGLYDDQVHTEALERSYSRWIDEFDEIESPDWDSETANGTEALAWYESITFHAEHAGIVITDRGIGIYASVIRRKLISHVPPIPDLNRLAIISAIETLLAHEIFHHEVEWFSLKLGNTFHTQSSNPYARYFKDVYTALRAPLGDDLIEESLATATMARIKWTKVFPNMSSQAAGLIKKAMIEYIPQKPPSYRMGLDFISPQKFKLGKVSLAATVFHLRPIIKNFNKTIPLIEITTSKFTSYFRISWRLEITSGSLAGKSKIPPFALSLPSKKIEKLLSQKGYQPTRLGKGSHIVWKADGLPAITLPKRTHFEGYQAMKKLAHSLEMNNVRELEETLRSL